MTTRPLDLASKLRPPPANFDWLFFVNIGALALFFTLFGSPFVLAPSLGVNFQLPQMKGAIENAQPATHHLSVTDSGQILVRDGLLDFEQLKKWLADEAAAWKQKNNSSRPVLLVQASTGVPMQISTRIFGLAQAAGFTVVLAVEEPKETARGGR